VEALLDVLLLIGIMDKLDIDNYRLFKFTNSKMPRLKRFSQIVEFFSSMVAHNAVQ
jgi:hypothetical protein